MAGIKNLISIFFCNNKFFIATKSMLVNELYKFKNEGGKMQVLTEENI